MLEMRNEIMPHRSVISQQKYIVIIMQDKANFAEYLGRKLTHPFVFLKLLKPRGITWHVIIFVENVFWR